MLKKYKINISLFLLFILSIPFVNSTPVEITLTGNDVDGDKMYAYLIKQSGSDFYVSDFEIVSDLVNEKGRETRFKYKDNWEDGHYKFKYMVFDHKATLEELQQEEGKEGWLSYYFPPLGLETSFKYTLTNKHIELEQKNFLKNRGNKTFYNVPIYDYMASFRPCEENVTYYKLNRDYIRTQKNPKGSREIIRYVDISPSEERGFIAKCHLSNSVFISKENNLYEFLLRWGFKNNLKNELFLDKLTYIIKIPTKNGIKVFNLISTDPEITPTEDEFYKYFQIEQNLDNEKENTQIIRIRYNYKLNYQSIFLSLIFVILGIILAELFRWGVTLRRQREH